MSNILAFLQTEVSLLMALTITLCRFFQVRQSRTDILPMFVCYVSIRDQDVR